MSEAGSTSDVDPDVAAAADPVARPRRRPWWHLLRWLPSAILLAVLVRVVADRWSALPEDGRLPSALALAVATVVNMFANALLADTWRVQLALTGHHLDRRHAVGIWSSSQFARLLFPGATIGARAVLGVRAGVSGAMTALTTIVEQVWSLLSQPMVIVLTMPWWVQLAPELRWAGVAAVVPVLVLVGLVVAPMRALRTAGNVLRVLPVIGRRVPADDRLAAARIERRTSAALGVRYVANALLRDLTFLLILADLVDLTVPESAAAVGAVALGRLVGLLAVFAPMGLGPREGVTVLVLTPVTGAAVAVVAVAAARLVEIVSEAAVWLVTRGASTAEPDRPSPAGG